MESDLERRPLFPPVQAFVVQFGLGTDLDAGRLVGRVEHVVSGKATRFQSLEALVAFMRIVLCEVEEAVRRTHNV